jgi:hypothetical protein
MDVQYVEIVLLGDSMRIRRRRKKMSPDGRHEGSTRPSRRRQLKLVLETVEQERANLSRAESLLECLRVAMEYDERQTNGPYYPDVAQIAGELVRKSVNALDSIHLSRLTKNKVEEEFRAGQCMQLRPPFVRADNAKKCVSQMVESNLPASLPSVPRPVVYAGKMRLRLHSRDYSRKSGASASNPSSHFSAATNISG